MDEFNGVWSYLYNECNMTNACGIDIASLKKHEVSGSDFRELNGCSKLG
jgi:hypothetical protein